MHLSDVQATERRPTIARLLLFCLSALFCVAAAEVTSRAFWRLEYGVPLRDPARILYAYYPELREVDRVHPTHEDAFYDVLLLDGSVLNPEWGPVEQELSQELASRGHRNVRIFNLATPAQTSRDSWLKYAALADARFELVVFYHGINEARANNVPPELFKEDYGHYSWYETVNALAPYHRTASFALPYTLRYLALQIKHTLNRRRYVGTDEPRPDWVQYGKDVRSATSFEHNLTAVLDLATSRGDRALVMTFATHVPDNYSLAAFKAKRLDYVEYSMPIEVWGEKNNVLNAVAAHNDIVRRLAAGRPGVLFVDQATLMGETTGSARDFNDPCHLTASGARRFVSNLLAVLSPTLPAGDAIR